MNYETMGDPGYSLVRVNMEVGEEISVEAGSIVAMEGEFEVQTGSRGLFKFLVTGEGLFLNKFIAQERSSVWFSPFFPGNVKYIELKDRGIIVASSSYLAHHGEITQEVVWKGFRGIVGVGDSYGLG